jgi:hypothetical protein
MSELRAEYHRQGFTPLHGPLPGTPDQQSILCFTQDWEVWLNYTPYSVYLFPHPKTNRSKWSMMHAGPPGGESGLLLALDRVFTKKPGILEYIILTNGIYL